jgi:signal transduction histidine kinase/ligand-binding sensor domain-containing protein/DNA-binding response OmpR family regulator
MQTVFKYLVIIHLVFFVSHKNQAGDFPAAHSPIRINYLTTNEGLPQNTIDCILKDSKGFIWFGTWNGLCRFDGYTFKIFQKQDEKKLPGNFIHSLSEDQSGNIWVGTENGLALFHYKQMKFVSLEELGIGFGNYDITSLLNDENGILWVATSGNGLWKIQKIKDGNYTSNKVFENFLPSESINDLILDENNNLMVATAEGLSVIPLKNEFVVPGWKELENELSGINIQTLFPDSKNELWLGTADAGLYHFDPTTGQLNFFGNDPDVENDLNHLYVRDIIEDLDGNIIVGTLGGLNYYDRSTRSFSHLTDQMNSAESLNSPFVNSLFSDEFGNVWIGTEKGGVNYYNTFQKPFYSLQSDPSSPNTLSHNIINSVYSENNSLWVGTAGGGLNKLMNNLSEITYFMNNPQNSGSLSSNFVTTIHRDAQNQLWVGTWGGGINRMRNESSNDFERFTNDPANHSSLSNNFVSSIIALDDYNLLVGTNGGFDLFSPATNTFLHVHEKMNEKTAPAVGCLLVDSQNRVWMGTENGLFCFKKNELLDLSGNSESVMYEKFLNNPNDSTSVPGNYIISIFESDDGTIWFGTYGNGICKLAGQDDSAAFITYSEQEGLGNNVAYAIEEDANGNLWISTDNGLSKFNPENETFQNFYRSDGLLSNQFYWSASAKDSNGNLYFGGVEGLNYFNPSTINAYPFKPQPVFTEFSIYSQPVAIGEKYHSKIILEKPVCETSEIELSYKDAVFSFEFSALDYFLPEKVKYAYKMEGVDQNWVEVSSDRRFANYTNLSGGEYVFTLKAANSDGVWNESPTTLTINIKPPIWQTTWFQILAVLFAAGLVLAYVHFRIRFLKVQKRKLELLVHKRTQQIEEHKQELEKQNEKIARQRDEVIELNKKVNLVNQHRLRFFTNISHEFRTPLTLIIDPLESLKEKYKNDKTTFETLSIINRNAQRLLHLINQLLYFRKIETGKLKLNVNKGNFMHYLHGVFESFKDLAEHRKINYQFQCDVINEEIWFDAEKLEDVFYNLLSNAFKNTPVCGSISLEAKLVTNVQENRIQPPFLTISVTDSGHGIAKEHLPHIFERFYRGEKNINDTDFSGSGIGLALTSEIVKALHGEIKVESEPGNGSKFTVCIPFTKDRFNAGDINQTALSSEINIMDRVNALSEHIIAKESKYEEEEMVDDKTKPTVLIVDDNFDLRNFLHQALQPDYHVFEAENGQIGFEIACKENPDVIVSDIMMPVMDGIEMCKLIKQDLRTSHIPVVLLTAKGSFHDQEIGYDVGADSYLTKPFSSVLLKSRLRNILVARSKSLSGFSKFKQKQQLLNESIGELDKDFLEKLTKIVEENLEDEHLNISQVATQLNMSHSTLYRKIKALTNLTANEFIRKIRIHYAEQLLLTGQYNISEIMFKIGINSSSYFRQCFKEEFGLSPSEYLQKLKNE